MTSSPAARSVTLDLPTFGAPGARGDRPSSGLPKPTPAPRSGLVVPGPQLPLTPQSAGAKPQGLTAQGAIAAPEQPMPAHQPSNRQAADSHPPDLAMAGTKGTASQVVNPPTAEPQGAEARATPSQPPLPRGRRPSFSSHRNDSNASVAVELLAQVGTAVSTWHQTLRQTIEEMQVVYRSGPVIEGWLEAVPQPGQGERPQSPGEMGLLRHGDVTTLASYVDHLSQSGASIAQGSNAQGSNAQGSNPQGFSPQGSNPQGLNTQYRLCSLDPEGRVQCQLCPPEQLGAVSQGIARYQQLRQLGQRKQTLEAKLQQAAAALTITRDRLDLPPAP